MVTSKSQNRNKRNKWPRKVTRQTYDLQDLNDVFVPDLTLVSSASWRPEAWGSDWQEGTMSASSWRLSSLGLRPRLRASNPGTRSSRSMTWTWRVWRGRRPSSSSCLSRTPSTSSHSSGRKSTIRLSRFNGETHSISSESEHSWVTIFDTGWSLRA